jgi:OmpA-OmpF porin, OOP family
MKYFFSFLIIVPIFCHAQAQQESAGTDDAETMTVTGSIFDDHLKAPIAASVTIVIPDSHPIRLSAAKDGIFKVPIPRSSWCTVTAHAPGFDVEENNYDLKHLVDNTLNVKIYLTPVEKLKMTGMILDKKTSQPVDAEFDLYYDTDIIKDDVRIAKGGKYEETFSKFGWYLVDIFAPGYLNTVDTIWVINLSRATIHKDYFLTPLETGLTVRLNNVYFDFGKATLTPDSYPELNRVADFLKRNPSVHLEIGGHTDTEGPHEFNLVLSRNRAQAVVEYIITKGANRSQLTFMGYGETKPIDLRENHLARATNRRVEFKVIKNP